MKISDLPLTYGLETKTSILGRDVDDLSREDAIHLAKWALAQAFSIETRPFMPMSEDAYYTYPQI